MQINSRKHENASLSSSFFKNQLNNVQQVYLFMCLFIKCYTVLKLSFPALFFIIIILFSFRNVMHTFISSFSLLRTFSSLQWTFFFSFFFFFKACWFNLRKKRKDYFWHFVLLKDLKSRNRNFIFENLFINR